MALTRYEKLAERALVTFAEAAIAYVAVVPQVTLNKTALAGALGAGLSAVYNFLRESEPTLVAPEAPAVVAPVVTPEVPTEPTPGAAA